MDVKFVIRDPEYPRDEFFWKLKVFEKKCPHIRVVPWQAISKERSWCLVHFVRFFFYLTSLVEASFALIQIKTAVKFPPNHFSPLFIQLGLFVQQTTHNFKYFPLKEHWNMSIKRRIDMCRGNKYTWEWDFNIGTPKQQNRSAQSGKCFFSES